MKKHVLFVLLALAVAALVHAKIGQIPEVTSASGVVPQVLSSGSAPVLARSFLLTALAANTGIVYVGDSTVSSTNSAIILDPGDSVLIRAHKDSDMINLADFYFSGTTGDKVRISFGSNNHIHIVKAPLEPQ